MFFRTQSGDVFLDRDLRHDPIPGEGVKESDAPAGFDDAGRQSAAAARPGKLFPELVPELFPELFPELVPWGG